MQRLILGTGFLLVAFTATPISAATLNQTSNTVDQNGPSYISSTSTPRFAKVIDDLPLMPGLQLVEDEDVVFSTSGAGRIAETNAVGAVDVDDVYKFYRNSLPHLGWKTTNARVYVREHEQLRIDARANQKVTVVRFTVKPTT